MPDKYETIPNSDEANYLLISMHTIAGINAYLRDFPKNGYYKGVSATVLWSGIEGSNVPVIPFGNQFFGVVLAPAFLEVPQADTVASGSYGRIYSEYKKNTTSKYPNKKGYYRSSFFTTNLARNEHIAGTKESIYHPTGSPEIFAKNIWRKFHKPYTPKYAVHPFCYDEQMMYLNEAIVFQKFGFNPIDGLVIRAMPSPYYRDELLNILIKYPKLKLYLYDINSKEHIVRWVDNATGQNHLRQSVSFESAFNAASPFKKFSADLLSIEQIDTVIADFAEKITTIQHPHSKALKIANRLLDGLTTAKENYVTGLNTLDPYYLAKQFQYECETAVNIARPILARDLNWDDYLTNLLKNLMNVIVMIGSLGCSSSFFMLKKSESEKLLESLEVSVKDIG